MLFCGWLKSENGTALPRRGRKITDHPIATSKRKLMVPVYLNVHLGTFSAKLDEVTFSSDRLIELRNILEHEARLTDGDMVMVNGSPAKVIDIQDLGDSET